MFLIDISNPIILLVALFTTLCLIYLGKEAKNSYIPAISLVVFLILLIMHGIQISTLAPQYMDYRPVIAKCLTVDFVMIFLTYMSYLWIDDIETKAKKKKSIDNSLEWFWKNV